MRMRWHLYIFFLSATGIFCFMLLTAATGNVGRGPSPKLESIQDAGRPARPEPSPAQRPSPVSLSTRLRPSAPSAEPFVYMGRNFDPAADKRDREAKAARARRESRAVLHWDENGWHHMETALVTAYCPCPKCCGSYARGITSIGWNAWLPGLAADPEKLGYGTHVFVPGYGLSVVDDTGGAMRRNWRRNGILHIDVRMTYHYEARNWGKRYLRVKIYQPGSPGARQRIADSAEDAAENP